MAKSKGFQIAKSAVTKRGKNYLFTAAVNLYPKGIDDLDNCCKDADDISKLLLEKYQFEASEHIALRDDECTRANIITELEALLPELTPADNLIVFFSGHGVVINESAYFLPSDAERAVTANYLSFLDLTNRLAKIKCKHFVLIYDGCHAGAIFRKTKNAGIDENDVTAVNRPSRVGLSSSHEKELSSDGRSGQNSPFTRALITELELNKRPLKINLLADLVQNRLGKSQKGKQVSVFEKLDIPGDENGQFIFTPKKEYYQLSIALGFLSEGNEKRAVSEFEMTMQANEKLPVGYEYHTAVPAFQLRLLTWLEKRQLIDKATRKKLSLNIARNSLIDLQQIGAPISGKDTLKNPRHLELLQMVGCTQLVRAHYSLFDQLKHKPNTLFSFFRISYGLRLLWKEWRKGILSPRELIIESGELLREFCLELLREELRVKKPDFNSKDLFKTLASNNERNALLALLRSNYRLLPVQSEKEFFLDLLGQRLRQNTLDAHYLNRPEQEIRIEWNRLLQSAIYLDGELERIQSTLPPDDESLFPRPRTLLTSLADSEQVPSSVTKEINPIKVFLKKVTDYLRKWNIEGLLEFIDMIMDDKEVAILYRTSCYTRNKAKIEGTVDHRVSRGEMQRILMYLKRYIDAKRAINLAPTPLTHASKSLREFANLPNFEEKISYLHTLLIQADHRNIIECIQLILPEESKEINLIFNALNERIVLLNEDQLFTQKPDKLLRKRSNSIIEDLHNLINQIVHFQREIEQRSLLSKERNALIKSTLDEAEELLESGKTNQAITLLRRSSFPKATQETIEDISQNHSALEEKHSLRIISEREYALRRNKTLFRILQIIEKTRIELGI